MKRIALISIALILCLAAVVSLAGCGDKKDDSKNSSGSSGSKSLLTVDGAEINKDDSKNSSGSSGSKSLLTVDGAEINSVELNLVGETPNLSVVFANNTDKDITIEAGEFSIKTADGTSYPLFESKTVLEANKSYIQHAYTAIKGDPSFSEGDTVEIWYGDTKLDTVTAKNFG